MDVDTLPSPEVKTAARKKPTKGRTKSGGKRPLARKSGASNSKPTGKSTSNDGGKAKKVLKETPVCSFRGPYVHVANDGQASVINTPLNEDPAGDKQKTSNKNFEILAASERNKLRGLHVSTLSNKYDADTRDMSWVCVSCKLGPHKYGLGDLFGPFILSTESEEYFTALLDANTESPSKGTSPKAAIRYRNAAVQRALVLPSTSRDERTADVSSHLSSFHYPRDFRHQITV